MNTPIDVVKKLRVNIIRNENGVNKFRIINSFKDTSMANLQLKYPIFRSFDVVKPSERRKLNIIGGFDMYNDSLMDYPSIIQSKMAGKWEAYNRLISVHIPVCPFNCWHCYNDKKLHAAKDGSDYYAAQEIVTKFLEQRNFDKASGLESNVLRITGGEPLLVPELILETLNILKESGLDKEVFVWTETNLFPLAADDKLSFSSQNILDELAKFDNLAIHPCFHGIDSINIEEIIGKHKISLPDFIKGIKSLIDHKLDIYPTIGSNVCNPVSLQDFFKQLYEIHKNLPMRFALIEYDLHRYSPIQDRVGADQPTIAKLYSKYQTLRIWNQLLQYYYGYGYGVLPRHMVSLKEENLTKKYPEFINNEKHKTNKELIYIFKSSYRLDYHREILDMLALPKGIIYKIEYDARYLQKDLGAHIKLRASDYIDKESILFYVDQHSHKKTIPLRKMVIKKVEMKQDIIALYVELASYISGITVSIVNDINEQLKELFGKDTLPPGEKYILFGEYVEALVDKIKFTDDIVAWRETVRLIYDLRCDAFKTSLFYKVALPDRDPSSLSGETPKSYYEIESEEMLSLTIDYYLPNYDNFDRTDVDIKKINYETTSDRLMPIGSNEIFLSKYGSDIIAFKASAVANTDIEVIISFKSLKIPFQAPYLKLPIIIKSAKSEANIKAGFAGAMSALAVALLGVMVSLYIRNMVSDKVIIATSLFCGVLMFLANRINFNLLKYKV